MVATRGCTLNKNANSSAYVAVYKSWLSASNFIRGECEPSCKLAMSTLEVVGLVLASGDALVKACSTLEKYFDAKHELPGLLVESKRRVHRMCASIDRYSEGVNVDAIPGAVLERAGYEFEEITLELHSMMEKHRASHKLQRHIQLPRHVQKVRETNQRLRDLEHHLDVCGLMSHETMSLREQLQNITDAVRKIAASQDDEAISQVIETIDLTLKSSADDQGDADIVDIVSPQARKLLDALSKSGIRQDKKNELVKNVLRVWNGWKLNPADIEFVRKSNGDRKRIGKGGAAEVYLADMKLRDEHDKIIDVDPIQVAVKQFVVNTSEANGEFASFVREVFLQKDAQHPCIVQTFGGYWPEAEEEEEEIEPWIVMERMTHNLRQVQSKQLLETLESKRRILSDIAAGIAHLHRRRIVHRDIKPENVLMRVADGRVVGRAKLCDFSVSRKAQKTEMMTTTMRTSTGLAGTLAYMPPEAFSNSAHLASRTARDIWSFGVLMCEVLVPDFLAEIVRHQPDGLHAIAGGGKFAEKVTASAQNISCDAALGELAIACLSLEPDMRPRIEDVVDRMAYDVPTYQFHFINYLSWEFRAKEVLRFMRHCFSVDVHLNDLATAVAVLEKAASENHSLPAQNVLAYCHHFGIGVEKDVEKAISLFQHGCDAGDAMAMFAEGAANFSEQRWDTAVPLLTKAAKMGSPGAKMYLATCFRYGNGVEKDENKAFQLTSSAAEAGNQDAQAWLASYFRIGIGTERNEKKAIAMLYGLSSRGNGFASAWLALWYKEGLVVEQDSEKSGEFLGLARKRGIVGSWVFNEERNWWVIAGN